VLTIISFNHKHCHAPTHDTIQTERSAKLAKLHDLRQRSAALQVEIAKYAANDPAELKKLEASKRIVVSAANRWTDNISELASFFRKKRPELQTAQIHQHFGLPAELEYVDE
jgi:hypothetical protein